MNEAIDMSAGDDVVVNEEQLKAEAAANHEAELAKAIAEFDRQKRIPHYQRLYFATPKDRRLGDPVNVEVHIAKKSKRGMVAYRYAPQGGGRLARRKGDTQPGQPYSKLIAVPLRQEA